MCNKLLRYYVLSNIHISITASIFVFASFIVIDQPVKWVYILFIFCGTLLIYNVHRIIGLFKINKQDQTERHRIQNSAQYFIYGLMISAVLVGTWAYYQMDNSIRLMLIPALILSFIYVTPILRGKRLRDVHFIKILVISGVWGYFFVIPILGHLNLKDYSIFVFLEKFLLILAITIPFDIRDRKIDHAHGLRTLATQISKTTAVRMAGLILMLSLLFALYLYSVSFYTTADLTSILLSSVITLFLIFNSINKKEWYFLAYLDGSIGLHGLLLILFSTVM